MSKLDYLPERAIALAHQVSGNLRDMMPSAGSWMETGAKLGAVKMGARAATAAVRRHPVVAVATVAGVGLLWYAARRRARRAEEGEHQTIEGSARRVEARDNEGRRRSARSASRRGRGQAAGESDYQRNEAAETTH